MPSLADDRGLGLARVARRATTTDDGAASDDGASDGASDGDGASARGMNRTRRRRAARFASVRLTCPACGTAVRSNALRTHLGKCARDALAAVPAKTWTATDGRDANACAIEALEIATRANDAFAAEVKRMCHRRREAGDGERMTAEACAEALGVPTARVKTTLRRASLAIELVRDETPLDVVFENDEFWW